MEIEKIFNAKAFSLSMTLGENGVGYYIPVYQREYKWAKEQITILFEDIVNSFNASIASNDALKFLGTAILINTRNIENCNEMDMPAKVFSIIDGQQRISTLIISNIILHEIVTKKIFLLDNKVNKIDEKLFSTLKSITEETKENLQKTFLEKNVYSKDGELYQRTPKIIRNGDIWRRDAEAKYQSPISKLIFDYIKFDIENDKKSNFIFNELNDEKYKKIEENYDFISRIIKKIINGDDEDWKVRDDIFSMLNDENNWNKFLNNNSQKQIIEKIIEDEEMKKIVLLIAFCKFILNRIVITNVQVDNDDLAFDIFESLNTTGEPLTAIETFKPKIVEAEIAVTQKFENSESQVYYKVIEKYCKTVGGKSLDTSEFIIPFVLSETGEKQSAHLRAQTLFLRNNYEKLNSIKEKREFIKRLSISVEFLYEIWKNDKIDFEIFYKIDKMLSEKITLNTYVLRDAKHKISLGIYFKMIQKLLENDYSEDVKVELVKAIDAITAFIILWRVSRRNTDGIDMHFRKIFGENIQPGIKSLSFIKSKNDIDVEQIKQYFKNVLENDGKILCRDDFIKKAKNLPIYNFSKPITKYLILAAEVNTKIENDGTLKRTREEQNILFNNYLKLSIEHIAPQSNTKWSSEIYESDDTIHTIGNLTLLPIVENNSLNNSAWDIKKEFYSIISEEDPDIFPEKIEEYITRNNIDIENPQIKILQESSYLKVVKSISKFDDWNIINIEKRSENILGLAYDYFIKWLQ